MNALGCEQELLDRLEASVRDGDPDPGDCDALATWLMTVGENGAAARWRSWALLPPGPEPLLRAVAEARRQLLDPGGLSQDPPPRTPAWEALLLGLERGAPAAELERLARELRRDAEATDAQRIELSQRLQQAGAPRAALALLDPLMPQARQDAPLASRMAQLQRACGGTQQAELWSRLSLRRQPEQPMLWFQLARLLLDQAVLDEAMECAETGLRYAPGHPWGLKLRANVLAANRAWFSFDRLRQAGEFPPDPDFVACLEADRDRYRRRASLGRARPEWPGLDGRLRLRRWLRHVRSPVALVHGRTGEALVWLLDAGVWTEPPPLACYASRDPMQVAERLAAAGFSLEPERPVGSLAEQARIDLLVIERPLAGRLPRGLAEPLTAASRVLAPQGLLRPPQPLLASAGGWQLFGRQDERDG